MWVFDFSRVALQSHPDFWLETEHKIPVSIPSLSVPPKIVKFSNSVMVNEGSNVTLMCLASGKPEPTISWKMLSQKGRRLHFLFYVMQQ